MNENGNVLLKIQQEDYCICSGPYCTSDIKFPVYPTSGDTPIGSVTKHYAGFVKELFTNADNFSITFPQDLDVKMKGVLLGACLLIDMMFFERSNKNNENRNRHRRH